MWVKEQVTRGGPDTKWRAVEQNRTKLQVNLQILFILKFLLTNFLYPPGIKAKPFYET